MDYDTVALILSQILNKSKSFKNAIYSNSSPKNLTSIYALVSETLKRIALLRSLLIESELLPNPDAQQLTENSEETDQTASKFSTDNCFYLVIAYEILFGHSNQVIAAFPNHPVVTSRVKLATLLTKNQANYPDPSSSSKSFSIPKYVRINGLKISLAIASKAFQSLGFEQVPLPLCESPINSDPSQTSPSAGHSSSSGQVNRQKYRRLVSRLKPKQFIADADFQDDMLVFHPRTDLHNLDLYANGEILIQDKASSLPARVLLRPLSSSAHSHTDAARQQHPVVIDACAAPGNKTVQLAELMENAGSLFAFDRDPNRFALLDEHLRKYYVANCTAVCADFLSVPSGSGSASTSTSGSGPAPGIHLSAKQLELCARAEYILVDPSCSGSGIVTRLDSVLDAAISDSEAVRADRLRRLSGFQLLLVRHALSFKHVRRVVYSTCSAYREENECVVLDALLRSDGGFALVRPTDPSLASFLSPKRSSSSLPPALPQPQPQPPAKRKRAHGPEREEGTSAGHEAASEHILESATLASLCSDADGRLRAVDLIASYCLHASPSFHLTNGFFVACFERVADS